MPPVFSKPGAPPQPDFQGPYPLCSSFALSKALVNGYEKGKFTNGVPVNINNQQSVAESLVNLFQDHLEEQCPTEFNQMSLKVWDSNMNVWDTKITVTRVQTTPNKELTKQNLNMNEYLISYIHDNGLHCVHVGNVSKDTVIGINSWGDNQYPWPQVMFRNIEDLFKVTFVANKVPPTYAMVTEDKQDTDQEIESRSDIFKIKPSESLSLCSNKEVHSLYICPCFNQIPGQFGCSRDRRNCPETFLPLKSF